MDKKTHRRTARRVQGYRPISEYALIGNQHSAALVSLDGSIDWCCLPRFDSPSVFAAILDTRRGGRFAITPEGAFTSTQHYLPATNVLETRFETSTGTCTVTDCMPLYHCDDGSVVALHEIIRVLRCQRGTVALTIDYIPRPEYAQVPVKLMATEAGLVWEGPQTRLVLQSPIPLHVRGGRAQGTLTLLEGDETTLVLSYHDPHSSEEPNTLPPLERVARTTQFWEGKAAALEYDGPWREEVVRAYLALHLLTYLPSGGIVAAPTTSLPEELGGVRNWDYRYTWLRDATFTIDALMSLGHLDEAREFFAWLSRICTECATRDRLQIMFRVDGSPDLAEQELPHLEGYRGSRPVRIGNGAAGQAQHDIYGEVLASAALMVGHDSGSVEAHWDVLHTLARLACTRWREPDSGIWEIRGGPYHFVYSKVMSWVALDRAVKLAEALGRSGPDVELWRATAEEVKREVLERGWNPRKQSFVQHYDSEAADASNLLIPLMDFLPPDDPRVVSTVECIRRELSHGPFVHRYRTSEIDDGLPGSEGAFTLCSFWMVQVLARMGRVQEARQLFQELLKCANHVGLYSEMVDPKTGQFLGNFPQAFTHIGLILAARECALGE